MAGTAELTAQYRRTQIALRALTLRQLLRIWPAFDLDDIDGSWPAVQQGIVNLIQARAADSARISVAYYEAFRDALDITGAATPRLADPLTAADIVPSLIVTGPATAARLLGQRQPNAGDIALTRVSGSVGRLTLNSGRDSLKASLAADRKAKGFRRITSANPCNFCLMLATRGGVYSAETADFQAHDHCSCTAEPAF